MFAGRDAIDEMDVIFRSGRFAFALYSHRPAYIRASILGASSSQIIKMDRKLVL